MCYIYISIDLLRQISCIVSTSSAVIVREPVGLVGTIWGVMLMAIFGKIYISRVRKYAIAFQPWRLDMH